MLFICRTVTQLLENPGSCCGRRVGAGGDTASPSPRPALRRRGPWPLPVGWHRWQGSTPLRLHIQCHRGHPQAGTAAATALSQPGMMEGISSSLGLDLVNDPPGWEVFAPRSPQTRGDFSYPWQSFHLPSSLSVDGVVFSCR